MYCDETWETWFDKRDTYRIKTALGASFWSRAVAYARATSDSFLCFEMVLPT